jgi:outer membrane receptor protein involved in Fe transport
MRWFAAAPKYLRTRETSRLGLLLACAGLAVAAVAPASAAQSGVLRGVVVDSTDGSLIENADILAASIKQVARSNDKGQFTLTKLSKGELEITIRRLGYLPQQQTIMVSGGDRDSVKVVLVAQPEVLQAIAIDAVERHRRQGIEDFYVRRTQGIGTFITRQQIEALRTTHSTDALRQVPGIQLFRTRSGDNTVRFTGTSSINHRDCPPNLWLDGQHVSNMELDQIPANDIEGIELYRGASTTPAQFWQGNTQNTFCGTIVVWSRLPGQ